MATVSRHSAVAKIGPLELSGYVAWVAWLALHLVYLVGFKSKIITLISWTTTFLTMSRGQLSITGRQARVPWRDPPNPIQRSTPRNDMRSKRRVSRCQPTSQAGRRPSSAPVRSDGVSR